MSEGKYDDLCGFVRHETNADVAVVLVFGGNKGHGFSVCGVQGAVINLPDALERMARDIRNDLQGAGDGIVH